MEHLPVKDEIEVVRLRLEQYCASMLVDELGWNDPQVRALTQYRIECLAHMLTAAHTAPALVLQNNRVLADYPTTLWDHIKSKLGRRHNRTVIRMAEHLTFPKVKLPHPLKNEFLVYVRPSTAYWDYEDGKPVDD